MPDVEVLDRPAGDVEDAFRAALAGDAQAPHSEMPAPPRKAVSVDPDAPHGRDDDGKPLAPYGLIKGTARPRLKPAGPGRPAKADKPRTMTAGKAVAAPGKPAAAGASVDYSAELAGLATSLWIGGSAIKGGKLPLIGLRVPDARPFAYVLHQQTPQLVGAWNQAAQQSPTVRGWVEKLAGEGSWQWVLAVGVTSANFLASCAELARSENAGLRAQLAERNDAEMAEFLGQAMADAEAA